jgi:hypothetical protein
MFFGAVDFLGRICGGHADFLKIAVLSERKPLTLSKPYRRFDEQKDWVTAAERLRNA